MIVGGTLLGMGMFSFGVGYYLLYGYSNSEDWGNEFAAKMEGTICLLGGGLLSLTGIPILSYNIYQYNVRKNKVHTHDEFKNTLERYDPRNKDIESENLQVILIPSLDLINRGGGLKTFIFF